MQQAGVTKRTIFDAAAIVFFLATAFGQAPPPTGDVFGFVVDEAGQPVSGAMVSRIQTFSPVKGAKPATGSAISQKDGAFFFRNLPPGSHRFCAELLGSDYLNPCEWSPSPPLANLTAGQIVSNLRIVLKKGARVHVRLDDPDKVLPTRSRGKPENGVFVFVRAGNGLPHVVPLVVDDANGRNHMLAVPFDVALGVSVLSAKLRVNDKDQRDKSTGEQTPVLGRRGDPPVVVRFSLREK